MNEIFLHHFDKYLKEQGKNTYAQEVCEQIRTQRKEQAPEAWCALVNFYMRHWVFGMGYFAAEVGITEHELNLAVEYFRARNYRPI